MQGVGSAQKRHLAVSHEVSGLRESLVPSLCLQRAPVHLSVCHTPPAPTPPCSEVMGELRTPATGWGPFLTFHALGSSGEFHAAPKSTAFSGTLHVRQAGGCGAPEHP